MEQVYELRTFSGKIFLDYVMLYDVSESIKEKQISLMIDFVSDFLKFIDIDNSDNRLTQAKIRSSYLKISDSLWLSSAVWLN